MKITKYIFILIAFFILISCQNDKEEALYSGQEKIIENIIDNLLKSNPQYNVSRNKGAYRITIKEGEGNKLQANGKLSFYYAIYSLSKQGINNNNLIATNIKDLAKKSNWNITDTTIFIIKNLNLKDNNILPGLKNGLIGVKQKEECLILFTTKYAFKEKNIGRIPANSGLIYHIWVENISNE